MFVGLNQLWSTLIENKFQVLLNRCRHCRTSMAAPILSKNIISNLVSTGITPNLACNHTYYPKHLYLVRFRRFFTNYSRVHLRYYQKRQCIRHFYSSETCQINLSRNNSSASVTVKPKVQHKKSIIEFRKTLNSGPPLQSFVANGNHKNNGADSPLITVKDQNATHSFPYLSPDQLSGNGRKGWEI